MDCRDCIHCDVCKFRATTQSDTPCNAYFENKKQLKADNSKAQNLTSVITGNGEVRSGKMTNYERLIKMLPEELATKIMCPYDSDGETCAAEGKNCNACCLEWLNREV